MKSLLSSLGMPALVLAGCFFTEPAFAQTLPNAWQITDQSAANGSTNFYFTNLNSMEAGELLENGFDFVVNARFVTNFSASHAMAMICGLGSSRFLVWWNLNSNNDLTAELEGNLTYTLTTNGTGAALYHTYEIICGGGTEGTVNFLFDGKVLNSEHPPTSNPWPAGQIAWGSVSSGGEGQMNFHSVNFTGPLTSISYDAGSTPETAQDPTSAKFGWIHAPTVLPPNTSVSNLSPDTADLPLAVSTALPASLTNSSARLPGIVYPLNSSVQVWFEWGTDTNYGNVTPVQNLGVVANGTSFHATVSNLVGGPDYHYRAVASNSVDVVEGEDQAFNLRFIRDYALPEWIEGVNPNLLDQYLTSVGDFNNDGWPDFLLTGRDALHHSVTQLWQNNGDGTFSNVTYLAPGLEGIHGPSAWGDYDNDGRLDFLIAGDDGTNRLIQLWRNTGSGFTNVPLPGVPGLGGINASAPSVLAWVDYDNDGRLDFMIMGDSDAGQIVQLWRNTGHGFTNVPVPGLVALRVPSLAWGDYDNDGQSEFLVEGNPIIIQTNHITPALWRNTGGGFTNVPIPGLPNLSKTYGSAVAFGDYDNDGLLDFLIAGEGSGMFSIEGLFCQLWRNTGSGFTNVPIPGLTGLGDGMVAWGDYNNDGKLDFVMTGTTNASGAGPYDTQVYENTRGGFIEKELLTDLGDFENGLRGFIDGSLSLADFNRDGRLDILISGITEIGPEDTYLGPRLFFNNMAVPSNAPPAAPANLSATVSGGRVSLRWTAPADDHTPSAGLSYNVRIGSTPGGRDIVSPPALPDGTLTLPQMGAARKGSSTFYNLPPGRYNWSVQAVDTSFAGSPFATEEQFTIGPLLVNPMVLPDGEFQFEFTNQGGLDFDVYVSTNVALPLANWTNLGPATALGGGSYRFTDPAAPGQSPRFYMLRSQ